MPGMFRKALILMAATGILAGCTFVPDSSDNGRREVRSPQAAYSYTTSNPDARQCHAQLGASNANFTPLPDTSYGDGCSTLNSVKLTALYGDRSALAVSNLGPVACPLANTFASWARYGVDRAASQLLGSGLARIETMGSYSCRNVAGSTRRSAHATANAIDVAAFILEDGRRISVQGDWQAGSAKEREFLRIVHRSACKRFGTVLGPDYNAAHRDHFHLEGSGSGYCR
jgi:hypothetical protein